MLQTMMRDLTAVATVLMMGLAVSLASAQQQTLSGAPTAQPPSVEGAAQRLEAQPEAAQETPAQAPTGEVARPAEAQPQVAEQAPAQAPTGDVARPAEAQPQVAEQAPAQAPTEDIARPAEAQPQVAEQAPAQPPTEDIARPAEAQPQVAEQAPAQPPAQESRKAAAEQEVPLVPREAAPGSAAAFYHRLQRVPPNRWGDLIDERRDYLTRRRQARYRDWARPRRYWNNPWSAARSDARWAYSQQRRDWARERVRHHRDLMDARRHYTSPWNAARRDWSDARTNYSRLRSLAMQERFDNVYGAPGGPFAPPGGFGWSYGPYGGPGGPWGPGDWW